MPADAIQLPFPWHRMLVADIFRRHAEGYASRTSRQITSNSSSSLLPPNIFSAFLRLFRFYRRGRKRFYNRVIGNAESPSPSYTQGPSIVLLPNSSTGKPSITHTNIYPPANPKQAPPPPPSYDITSRAGTTAAVRIALSDGDTYMPSRRRQYSSGPQPKQNDGQSSRGLDACLPARLPACPPQAAVVISGCPS